MKFTTTTLLSLAAYTYAQSSMDGSVGGSGSGSSLNFDDIQSQCPDGWSFNQNNGGPVVCCPGRNVIIDQDAYCVVGSSSVPNTAAGYTSIVSSLAAAESGSGSSSGSGDSGVIVHADASTTVTSSVGGMMTSMAMSGSRSGASGAAATSAAGSTGSSSAAAAPTGLIANAVVGAAGGALLYLL